MGQYDTAFYLKIDVDLCDLYFIAQCVYSRYTKYVGVISFRFSVHSFIFLSRPWTQGQSFCVKVYKTSYMYFKDSLMDFIHIWTGGRYMSKVFISTIPTLGVTVGSRSRT